MQIEDTVTAIQYEHGEAAHAVLVENFDFASLDTLEDEAREALREGRPLREILESAMRERETELKLEGLRIGLSEVIDAPNPLARTWQLVFVAGMDLTLGLSGTEIAAKLGYSKQAFQNGVDALRRSLFGQVRNATMRSEESRAHMSESHANIR